MAPGELKSLGWRGNFLITITRAGCGVYRVAVHTLYTLYRVTVQGELAPDCQLCGASVVLLLVMGTDLSCWTSHRSCLALLLSLVLSNLPSSVSSHQCSHHYPRDHQVRSHRHIVINFPAPGPSL